MPGAVGEQLSAARRARGKSLAEAEAATKIRTKLLEALERGEYETLPSPAYVRGYIISYAKYLEVDPEPLLKAYTEETGHSTNRDRMRLPEQVVTPRGQAFHLPTTTIFTIVALVVLIALAVWGIGRIANGPDEVPPIPNVPETTETAGASEQTAAPGVTSSTVDATSTTDESDSAAAGEPFTLKVDIAQSGASWLRVTVDGLKAYEGTLSGGQSKEWEVTDTAVIRVGKPSAVTIYRDGTPVEIPPASETPEVTLSVTDPVQ